LSSFLVEKPTRDSLAVSDGLCPFMVFTQPGPFATHIVLQPNVGSWGKSGSRFNSLEVT
jgi:hypothetical protein